MFIVVAVDVTISPNVEAAPVAFILIVSNPVAIVRMESVAAVAATPLTVTLTLSASPEVAADAYVAFRSRLVALFISKVEPAATFIKVTPSDAVDVDKPDAFKLFTPAFNIFSVSACAVVVSPSVTFTCAVSTLLNVKPAMDEAAVRFAVKDKVSSPGPPLILSPTGGVVGNATNESFPAVPVSVSAFVVSVKVWPLVVDALLITVELESLPATAE